MEGLEELFPQNKVIPLVFGGCEHDVYQCNDYVKESAEKIWISNASADRLLYERSGSGDAGKEKWMLGAETIPDQLSALCPAGGTADF